MTNTGRRPAMTPEDVLEVMEERDELFYSTKELAEAFDTTRPTVLKRLDTLQEEGAVREKTIGKSSAWYLPSRENYRLAQFASEAGAQVSELRELLDRHGPERVEEAIGILDEHDGELEGEDIEVLEVAASALARGRNREQVINTLEVDDIEPGMLRDAARKGMLLSVAGGGFITYGYIGIALDASLPIQTSLLGVGLAAAIVGFVALIFAVLAWNLRRIGRTLDYRGVFKPPGAEE